MHLRSFSVYSVSFYFGIEIRAARGVALLFVTMLIGSKCMPLYSMISFYVRFFSSSFQWYANIFIGTIWILQDYCASYISIHSVAHVSVVFSLFVFLARYNVTKHYIKMWNNDKVVSREYVNNVPLSSKSISGGTEMLHFLLWSLFSSTANNSSSKNNKTQRFTWSVWRGAWDNATICKHCIEREKERSRWNSQSAFSKHFEIKGITNDA